MRNTIACFVLLINYAFVGLAADPDDRRVKEWIAASVGDLSDNVDTAVATTRPVLTLERGWRELKRCRDSGLSRDLSLAAAEHFMFMRFLASRTGDSGYTRLPKWYEAVKGAALRNDLDHLIQSSNQPVTPPNTKVTSWGEAGVTRGLDDYRAREGKEPHETGASLVTLFGSSFYIYYFNTLGDRDILTGTCEVFAPPRGTWVSADPAARWTLVFDGADVMWTETAAGGAKLTRAAKLRSGANPGSYKISRENDADALNFLGFSPAIRTAVLARTPRPSFMVLTVTGTDLTGDWSGLLVIKDAQAQFKEMKQPGETAAKTYSFVRK